MPTLDLQVGVSAGDSEQNSIANDSGRNVTQFSVVFTNNTILSPGSHSSGDEWTVAARFPSVTIDQGATIDSAAFKMTADSTYSAGSNVVQYFVSAQASDNAPALSNTSGDLNVTTRPRTSASATWIATSVTGGVEYSTDITAVIQEVINRAGWTNGSAIVILVDTHPNCTIGEWQDFESYDGSAANAPRLSITYSTGGGGGGTVEVTGVMRPMGIW